MVCKNLGVGLMILTIAIVWHCVSPLWWATTEGKASTANVVDKGGARYEPPRYRLNLSYSYQVNGKTHAGQGFIGYANVEIAQTDAQRFISGSPISVYYDPGNPGMSMLAGNRNLNLRHMLMFIFVEVVIVIWFYTRVVINRET